MLKHLRELVESLKKERDGIHKNIPSIRKCIICVELPEEYSLQFFQVEFHFVCNRIEDQIRETLPYPREFYSPHHR